MDKRVQILKSKYRWYEGTALVLIEANGKCVYCGENLMDTRLGYSSMVMDHLLPKAIYPVVEYDYRNHVLSCVSCNSMKGNYDLLEGGENPDNMLNNREILVRRCIDYLQPKIDSRKLE